MRRGPTTWAAALALVATCTPTFERAVAQPTTPVTASSNRKAYDAAMKCFVVNGSAHGEREDAGDAARAAAYEAKARQSFDVAVKLGHGLGFSEGRINQDFGLVQARELPKLVTDQDYNRRAAATCKAIGLM